MELKKLQPQSQPQPQSQLKPVTGNSNPKPEEQVAVEAVATAATAEASTPAKPLPFVITTTKRSVRWLKMLVYGEYGVGKTTLAASSVYVPDMNDVILIDIESGDLSLSGLDIDRIGINSYSQLARVYEFLRLHCRFRDDNDVEKLCRLESQLRQGAEVEKPKRWKTVIIDSLSEAQKYCMYYLLGIKVGERALDLTPDVAEFKEWNQSAEMIRLLVRSFRDLPMNVIFVASEQIQEDERKQLHRRPNLPGKLGGEVQGFLDVVGYMVSFPAENGNILRRLYVQPGRTFQAKTRFAGSTANYLDDPTMLALYNLSVKKETKNG